MNHIFNQITVLKSANSEIIRKSTKSVHWNNIPQLLGNAIWRHLEIQKWKISVSFALLTYLARYAPSLVKLNLLGKHGGQSKCLYNPLRVNLCISMLTQTLRVFCCMFWIDYLVTPVIIRLFFSLTCPIDNGLRVYLTGSLVITLVHSSVVLSLVCLKTLTF